VQQPPAAAGIDLANWSWKVVRQFLQARFGRLRSSRRCLNYLHRLGFVVKRRKKRLVKASAEKRQAFVAASVALRAEAERRGA
jgi:transposase